MVAVNQIGYGINEPKIAVFVGEVNSFDVVDKIAGKTVFTGRVGEYKSDVSSGDKVGYGDFSQLRQPGTYYIYVDGKIASPEFIIAGKPYKDIKNAMLKAFYYQRCGIALQTECAGAWGHDACHTADGYLYDQQDAHIDATGGWHDAGDYGKYVVPAAKAVADLMLAYEICPESFKEQVNIPESGNVIPDILNEVRYELEWMLEMQNTQSGGVYHKIATLNFPGFIMPEDDKDERYINAISATATADFAAAMAMAYRIYKPIDRAFAEQALKAAQKAWRWIEANPGAPGFKNPTGVNSGEYGDSNDRDERFWAAVELYRASGQQEYHNYIKSCYKDVSFSKTSFGWATVGGYGTVSYLMMKENQTDKAIYDHLKTQLMSEADRLVRIWSNDGYKVTLEPNGYYWGSNGEVMNRAMCLIFADNIVANDKYVEVVRDQLSYILGRNALGQCYLTGFGAKSVMHPHHRPSQADGIEQPIPGMLAGGPNSGRQDPAAENKIPAGTPPAKCYIDDVGSYSTNEIAIYWNSPAVLVAAYFDK